MCLLQIVPEMEYLTTDGAKFADGSEMEFDAVIFATGYRNNAPSWLMVSHMSLMCALKLFNCKKAFKK